MQLICNTRNTVCTRYVDLFDRLDVDGGAHGSIDAASNTDGGDDHLGDAAAAAGRHVRFTSRDNLKPLNLSSMTVSVSTDADLNVCLLVFSLFFFFIVGEEISHVA